MRLDSNGRSLIGTTTAGNTNQVIYSDGTSDNKPAILFQNALTGTGSSNGFYVGGNHNDQVGYVWNYESQPLVLATSNTERMRIDSSGRLLVGHTSSQFSMKLSVAGTDGGGSSCSLSRFSNNSSPSTLLLSKSRGTSVGSYTVVQDDDQVGSIDFRGADGTDNNSKVAEIIACIDGTPGSNDMPGRLQFHTTSDGASSTTERMRIDSSGTIKLNQTDSMIMTNADSSRLRLFGGSSNSVNNGAALTLLGVSNSSGNYADLASGTSGHIQFRTGTSERMRIDSSGRVLIGTTDATTVGTVNKNLVVGSTTNNDEVGLTLNVMEGTNGRRVKFFLDDNDGVFGVDSTASTGVAPFVVRMGTTERMRILAGGGLTFNGDTAAANALDDYEEGTWTPVVKSAVNGSVLTYGAGSNDYEFRSGNAGGATDSVAYTKIGNRVFLSFSIYFNTSATHRYNISLPFARAGNDYQVVSCVAFYSISGAQTLGILGNGNTFDTFEISSGGGHIAVSYSNSSEVYYNFQYQTT